MTTNLPMWRVGLRGGKQRGLMSKIAFAPRAGARRAAASLATIAACLLLSPDAGAWQPGKDGSLTVNANTAYASLPQVRITTLSTAATAGATTLTLASAAGISSGDVLMVYQAQGATINTTDTAAYGTVSSLGNSGRYELVSVLGVVGNTVTLDPACSVAPLRFSYGTIAQVIRVPQYASLTLSAGVTLSAPQWNGTTGGVMPLLVRDTFQVSGSLSASGAGFRGGVVDNATTAAGTDVTLFRGNADVNGGEKGEGIVGFQAQYDALNGRYGRGAPANGGGGGNAHNGGGGGGANGASGLPWTGQGNPSLATPGWAAAWNLDGAVTPTSTSSGGGRGGYTFGSVNLDALTIAPGTGTWGGNSRRQRGGWGGRPLANDAAFGANTRVHLGGGGGAGDSNNGAGGTGARGGGLVLVIAGTLSGSGEIVADGSTAANSVPAHNDAPGGGGAGGSILVSAVSASGVALRARGGNGGNQLITNAESEGPGGGGGGGFIAAPAILTATVTGGANGTTSSTAVTEFIPNGATAGGAGSAVTVPALSSLPLCIPSPQLTMTKTASAASFTLGVPASYTLSVQNTGTAATTAATTITDTIPTGLTIGTLPAGCTAAGQTVTCTVAAGLAVSASTSFVIPVTPTLAAGASVVNTATVSGGG
ncbi:MAG: hypothetical protein NT046_10435, partial [Arenimonas sp.]|nr:hypothetical protein [Arenimonas sp.]